MTDPLLPKLEAAELRIGMCEDAKLAALLNPALVNILGGFLSSPSPAVKQKTMGILSHLNKRLKADTTIALPLAGLTKLFTTPTTQPLVANFALVYIEMGLPRVSAIDRSTLLPQLLVGVAKRPAGQQDTLLALLLAGLPSLPLPKTKAQLPQPPPDAADATDATAAVTPVTPAPTPASATPLPFLIDSSDRALVLMWLLDLLLYLPPLASAPHVPPPGLSRAAAKRVCGKLDASEVRLRRPQPGTWPRPVITTTLALAPGPCPTPALGRATATWNLAPARYHHNPGPGPWPLPRPCSRPIKKHRGSTPAPSLAAVVDSAHTNR